MYTNYKNNEDEQKWVFHVVKTGYRSWRTGTQWENYCEIEEWKLHIKNSAYLSWQQAELLCNEHKCDKTNNLSNIPWDIYTKKSHVN